MATITPSRSIAFCYCPSPDRRWRHDRSNRLLRTTHRNRSAPQPAATSPSYPTSAIGRPSIEGPKSTGDCSGFRSPSPRTICVASLLIESGALGSSVACSAWNGRDGVAMTGRELHHRSGHFRKLTAIPTATTRCKATPSMSARLTPLISKTRSIIASAS